MKKSLIVSVILLLAACSPKVPYGRTVTLDSATLMDKIKGGWYGQTIGCTYGGPTEFKYKGGLMMEADGLGGSQSKKEARAPP